MQELLAVGLSPLVGREAELTALGRALGETRLVTVTGPGGVGKTRLALAALQVRSEARVAVELGALTDPALVAASILAAAGGRMESGVDPVDTLSANLTGRALTLFLDNCEHVLDQAAVVCGRLLSATPDLRILATSRVPLGIPGELAFELQPLSLGPDGDAVRLFVDRARRANREFTADQDALEHIASLCAELDGLALAIELAAARTRVLDLERIATDLERRLDVLAGGPADRPRHRSLRASMEWSYGLLTSAELALFERLSVFAGGWELEGAEAVCAGPPVDGAAILDLLGALVDRSLVTVERAPGATRFSTLRTVRAYAEERLAAAGEEEVWRHAHAVWCRDLVAEAESRLMGRDQIQALSALDRETDNVRAALAWSRTAAPALGLQIAAGMALYWHARGRFTEGRHELERLLAQADAAPAELGTRALWALGLMLVSSGELAAAKPVVAEAVERAREMGEPALLARTLNLLGELDLMADPVAANKPLDEAVSLARAASDAWCLADALGKLGAAALYRSDAGEAKPRFAECLEIGRRAGDERAAHRALGGLARVAAIEGEAETAIGLLRESLSLSTRLGDRSWIAIDLAMLGELERFAGRAERGRSSAQQGLALAEQIDGGYPRYLATGVLGRIALALGEEGAATELLTSAVELGERNGLRPFASWWRLGLSDVDFARGDLDAASAHAQEALAAAQAIGNRRDAARATSAIAFIALARRDPDVAIAHFTAALAVQREIGDDAAARRSLEGLVRAFTDTGKRERADRLRSALAREPDGLAEAVALALRGRSGNTQEHEAGWAGLTSAEAEVAELAAAGATNPEIAERLFMSRSTVKTHLSRVYAKLSVANRTELATAIAALRTGTR